ncbi:MAG: type II CRISPR RNA-guided endonuclease Cas9 [Corallococcus sp.]|nr:type II CRISPR RNA-guided endonuclease Cas9 [Corallococcus sp.]
MNKKGKQSDKNYYLGLDIGTDSVGWAATDEQYKLLRANNKSLWGVRLFDSANAAAARRLNRESRRRLERRKWRIGLLQQIFAPIINNVDENFFARLSDSNLYDGDKREKTIFSLFSDKNFTDKDFYSRYKTIYHLRLAMMNKEDPDPRLVYLALHHIVKYRGHFLNEGDTADIVENIAVPLQNINVFFQEKELPYSPFDLTRIDGVRACLMEKVNKTQRALNLRECFGIKKNTPQDYLLQLIAGKTVKIKNIINDVESDVSFAFDDWESKEAEIHDILQDDFVVVENAKALYDYSVLKAILGNYKYISEGMVAKYDKHRNDLSNLKYVLKTYATKQMYQKMFKSNENNANYSAYSGYVKGASVGGKRQLFKTKEKASDDDFFAYVKKVLTAEITDEGRKDNITISILDDIENGTFLPKQVSKNNSTLPYQVNLKELDAILENVSRFARYAFLNEADENGITAAQKIRSLLTFRMPYFVGPTNNHSGKYWIVRNAEGKIYPWNYSEQIDLESTEQRFIERLTNYCQYISDEKVLPKCSLLYEEYVFLNIVNTVKVNGERLSVDVKQKLSDYYATSGESKLTQKKIKILLQSWNLIEPTDDVSIEGFDDGATVHRKTYYQFVKIFGSADEVETRREQIEKIILYATIAGSEKGNLVRRLQKEFGSDLKEKQIAAIKGLTLNGWGRFSEKLLTDAVGVDKSTGEVLSIIDTLRNTQMNFMEIWNSNLGFKEHFDKRNLSSSGEINYGLVDSLYCSPAVKKQIWQTLSIIKELTSVIGYSPAKIFVEVARDKTDKDKADERKRTNSRYNQLKSALSALNEQNNGYAIDKDVLSKLENCKPEKLQDSKLYLYFMQNGIDIYTGEMIDYNNLYLYDKDHIYPRSKVKDDSILNNLVLTYRSNNADKKDVYPIAEDIRKKMQPVWQTLVKQGLMTEEKYKRLTRNTPLTDNECADFINRQLVETRQSTKEVIRLLTGIFPESEIVWSKAGNVSDFRSMPKQQGEQRIPSFIKCRAANDLHHAKDAYLNIVVGNAYNVRYGHNARYWMECHPTEKLTSSADLFKYDIKTQKCTAWIAGCDGTIAQVNKTMRSNAILFTRESKVAKGALFNATLQKKSNKPELVPLKGVESSNRKFQLMSNTAKYGGYISETRSYYMLVKFVERKQNKKAVKERFRYKFLGVTAKDASRIVDDASRIAYCIKNGLNEPNILIPKIKIQTMFEVNGTVLSLAGMTGSQIVWRLAQQHILDDATERYLKNVVNVEEKYNDFSKRKETYCVSGYDNVTAKQNEILYEYYVEKLYGCKDVGSLVSLAKKLDDEVIKSKFISLQLAEQCKVLTEIAKSLQCNASLSDLSLLGESKISGRIRLPATFDSLNGIKIIYRSVTGIFEQKIPLSDFDKETTL